MPPTPRRFPSVLFLAILCLSSSLAFAVSEQTSQFAGTALAAKAAGAQQLEVATYDQLLTAIRQTHDASQTRLEAAAEAEKVREAWETGNLIKQHILLNKERANYGEQVIERLAGDLGTGKRELQYMVEFARTYPIVRPAAQLSWSHYEALLSINDMEERKALAEKAEKNHWNRRTLRKEIRKHLPSHQEEKLEEVKPGKIGVYKVIKAPAGPYKGERVLDLGFSNYLKLGILPDFKEGELVYVDPSKSKKGFESTFHFQHVLPEDVRTKVRLNADKKDVFGTDDMLYTYPAYVTSVVDGDTFHAIIDLGFGLTHEERLRLRQLDAPELITADGKKAKEVLEKVLGKGAAASEEISKSPRAVLGAKGPSITIKVSKTDQFDQYGRYLVDVFVLPLRSDKTSSGGTQTTGDEYGWKSIDEQLLQSEAFTVRGDE